VAGGWKPLIASHEQRATNPSPLSPMTNPYQPPDRDFPEDDALDHDHDRHDGPDYDEAREYWPTCPDCGRRLTITCPFCKTTDDLFPLGDTEYWDDDLGGSLVEYQRKIDRKVSSRSVLFGDGDTSMPLDEHGCSCNKPSQMPHELFGGTRPELTGSCRQKPDCGCDRPEDGEEDDADAGLYDMDDDELFNGGIDHDDDDLPERDYDSESLPFVVICPTCSEAFIPSFPGGCRHCHYVWDKSKPLDAELAVDAHQTFRKAPNPALQEPGGLTLVQWAVIGAVVLAVLILIVSLLTWCTNT